MPSKSTSSEAGDKAKAALTMPMGLASPLWLTFGAAAAFGATYFWMTRWTRFTNLEAVMAKAAELPLEPQPTEIPAPDEVGDMIFPAELAHEADMEVAAAAEAAEPDAITEAVSEATAPEPTVEAAPEPVLEAEPETPPARDDLTRLVGIGPKLSAALAARGVTRFAHLAAWTAKDLKAFDKALDLKGRAERDQWVAQARRFVENSAAV